MADFTPIILLTHTIVGLLAGQELDRQPPILVPRRTTFVYPGLPIAVTKILMPFVSGAVVSAH
jgi:hypothetical protein